VSCVSQQQLEIKGTVLTQFQVNGTVFLCVVYIYSLPMSNSAPSALPLLHTGSSHNHSSQLVCVSSHTSVCILPAYTHCEVIFSWRTFHFSPTRNRSCIWTFSQVMNRHRTWNHFQTAFHRLKSFFISTRMRRTSTPTHLRRETVTLHSLDQACNLTALLAKRGTQHT